MFRKIGFILILLLMLLFTSNLFSYDFVFKYTCVGSMMPFEKTVVINDTVYKSVEENFYQERMEIFTRDIPEERLSQFIKDMINEYRFFELAESCDDADPDRAVRMDCNTEYITIIYKGQTHKIGGYDVRSYSPYAPVFQCFYDLSTEVLKMKKEELYFTLNFTRVGSMSPIDETIVIHDTKYKRVIGNSERGQVTTLTGEIPEEVLNQFISDMIHEYQFFELAESCDNVDPDRPVRMDCDTEFITITYKGQIHTIGGYDVDSYAPYVSVFQCLYRLFDKVENINKEITER